MITSFRHDRQQQVRRRKLLGLLAFFLFILFIFRTPVAGALSSFFLTLARPIWVANASVEEWWKASGALFSFKESLVAKNVRLEGLLDAVTLDAYSRDELRAENERLKAMLGRASGRSFILARVLATPGRSPYDTFVLDVGLLHGVTPGMKVFTDGDIVIGKVEKATNRTATVTLYSSYGNELPVTIGTSSIPAVAKGMGGGNFRIALPVGVPVLPGDLAHIPAIAPEYAGMVVDIDRPEGSSLQDIYLKWPFNMNELAWVYVAMQEEVSEAREENEGYENIF